MPYTQQTHSAHTHMYTIHTRMCGVWLVRLSDGPPSPHTQVSRAASHPLQKQISLFSIFLDDAVSMATKPTKPGQLSAI